MVELASSAARSRATVDLRPAAGEDWESIFRLYSEVFGEAAAASYRRRYRWSQLENLFPEQTPRWVLASKGRLVGFVGTIPLEYQIGSERFVAHTPCDYMVAPEARFHGIKLMSACFKSCANIVSLDDIRATIEVCKFLKAHRVETLQRWAKPLDASLLARKRPSLAKVPGSLWHATRVPFAVRDLVSAPTAWIEAARAVRRHRGDFDRRFDDYDHRRATELPDKITLRRDARYFRWRYGPASPHAGCAIGTVEAPGGHLDGYVVAAVARDAERTGVILELDIAEGVAESRRDALVAFALAALHRMGAGVVRWHVESAEELSLDESLRRFGFSRRASRHELLVKTAKPLPDPQEWRYFFGDAEASHALS